ncbi:putative lipid II flippase MurJ [Gammaproteobacteria bacterium]
MSKRLLQSTFTVGGMTLISRIVGFLRDMVIARYFGAGNGADAFFVAFRIPNFLRRLFAEGSFSQAFVPVLSEHKTLHGHDEVRALVSQVEGTLGLVVILVTVIGVLAAPLLVMLFAPGFSSEPMRYALTVEMLRITFPYLTFISLAALAGGVLNTYGRFGVPAFTPVFLNLAMIAGALVFSTYLEHPVTGLAWGVLLGGILQLIVQLPPIFHLGLLVRPQINFSATGVRRILRLMGPTLFGSSVAQINLLFDTIIASFLVSGSVSWLYYSDRLLEFPLGVFGIAIATVILPKLSTDNAAHDSEGFIRTLDWALRLVVLIGIPAGLGLALLGGPLLATLFQYGEFVTTDTQMATRSLMAFALGLPAFILIKVLVPGFYARQDTRTPVRIGITAMLSNMVCNVILVFPLAHAGLALATTASAYLNASLLYRKLRQAKAYHPLPGWRDFFARTMLANLVMGAVLWWGAGDLESWITWKVSTRALNLMFWIVCGGGAYLGALAVLGINVRAVLVGRDHLATSTRQPKTAGITKT